MQGDPNIPQIIKKILPAVVSISISKDLTVYENPLGPLPFGFKQSFMIPKGKKKIKIGGGSGFIIDSCGLILTNRHVVSDPQAEYIVVLNNQEKYETKILANDPINDVAILKIDAQNDLPTIELGDSFKTELGETVMSVGNTLGIFQNTVSVGVVSGLSRRIEAFDALGQKPQSLRGLIQTDAAINPGNSGGPLINLEGKVIGINAAMVIEAENVGFAIPINSAVRDLEELKNYGRIRRPFLGIRYISITENLQKKFSLPTNYGVLVISEDELSKAVVPNSPADKAGLKEGDIVLEVQNNKISLSETLEDILQKLKIGEMIEMKVLRNDEELLKEMMVEERK